MVVGEGAAKGLLRARMACRGADSRIGCFGDGLNGWLRLRRFGHRDFNINGIDEGGQRRLVLLVGLRPDAQEEADNNSGWDGSKPGRYMEVAVAAPGADV